MHDTPHTSHETLREKFCRLSTHDLIFPSVIFHLDAKTFIKNKEEAKYSYEKQTQNLLERGKKRASEPLTILIQYQKSEMHDLKGRN